MTIELFFVAGSFVVGVGQLVEASVIRRDGGKLTGPMQATTPTARPGSRVSVRTAGHGGSPTW